MLLNIAASKNEAFNGFSNSIIVVVGNNNLRSLLHL